MSAAPSVFRHRVPYSDADRALHWYVVDVPASPSRTRTVTSYYAALHDARRVTGRDMATGTVPDDEPGQAWVDSWAGAVCYLVFLDQIGSALRLKGSRDAATDKPAVMRALRTFADPRPTLRDRQAIYGLRCSFMHDYSLFNMTRARSATPANLRFHFALHGEVGEPLVEHASRRWKGDLETIPLRSTRTWVNLRALGDAAESCHGTIQSALAADTLRARLSPNELIQRYTITIQDARSGL